MAKTISYSKKINGWTTFHSFHPQGILGMNNKLYSFYQGELWEHHSNKVPRNNYYGVQYPSKVSIVMNTNPSDVKFLKAIGLESTNPWDIQIKAYEQGNDVVAEGVIHNDEFVKKEGMYYAYARRNEDDVTFDNKSAYGLGVVIETSPFKLVLKGENYTLAIDDYLYTEEYELVGKVINVIYSNNRTEIEIDNNGPSLLGKFIIGVKNARVEGSFLRGYAFRYDLENEGLTRSEIFAVNSEVEKSYI